MWDKLQPLYIELLRIAWSDARDDGTVTGAFDVSNPYVQDVLKDLAKRVVGIDETTQALIQAIIGDTALSTSEKRDRLLEMAAVDSATRADMISRTETATAHEAGNHLAWRASGQVDRKEWLLGPNPCPDCQPLGGRVIGLDDEFAPGVKHPPFHPNCTCATSPVVKA